MKRTILLAATAAVLLPVAAQAEIRSERVSVADIRPDAALMRVAEQRIEAAAERVCDAGDQRQLTVRATEATCAADARAAAMARLEQVVPARTAVTVKVAGQAVSLRDLRLTQPRDRRAAEARLAAVARRACDMGYRQDLRMLRLESECEAEALRVAHADLSRATRLAARGGVQVRAAR